MARRNLGNIINSVKNVIDTSGALVDGTASINILAKGVDAPALSVVSDVKRGCIIKNFYLSVFVFSTADGTAAPVVDWYIIKNVAGEITLPGPEATGVSDVKRFIFHEEKGLAANTSGTPMVFKGVVRVPKHMQRMGSDDQFTLVLKIVGEAGFFCIKAIYKWYT